MSKSGVGKKKLNIKEKLTDDSLDLSVCSLEAVPIKEIVDLNKVRKLNLSYNLLVTLSDDFIKLQFIRELDLSKNKLTSLPKNFGCMINLRNLDLLGNELTMLPASFCELKSLQWLDLKDNPLVEPLKKAAGDCFNEAQCKKCAVNVISFMKQVAADEERRRQQELKKKREEQSKKEAEEKEKAEQLRQQKKIEREQRRLVNEQKKKQMFESEDHNGEPNGHSSNGIKPEDKKRYSRKSETSGTFTKQILKGFLWLLIATLLVGVLIVGLSKYCDGGFKDLHANKWLQSVDERVCPTVIRNKPLIRNLLKPFEAFI